MITKEMVNRLVESDPHLQNFFKNIIPKEDVKRIEIINGIALMPNDQMICMSKTCGKSVIGDPKYHEVYREGIKVGYRHRKCII